MNEEYLQELENAFSTRNISTLKSLSSELSHEAFLNQDRDLVELSVLSYSLAKLCEKQYIVNRPEWSVFAGETEKELIKAIKHPGKSQQIISALIDKVEALSNSFGRFVLGVLDKSRIKAAVNMYARGASLGTAADLSGAPKNEIADYVGATRIPEKYADGSIKQRLITAREVLLH